MKSSDIEYVLTRLLPDGWRLETLARPWPHSALVATLRNGATRAEVQIPFAAIAEWDASNVVAGVMNAIDEALGIGRYATTPIITPEKPWSPYP